LKLISYLLYHTYKKEMESSKSELDIKIEKFNRVLAITKCQCCNETPLRDTFGEWHQGKWWCFNHVDILFKSEKVNNLSELWQKGGGDS